MGIKNNVFVNWKMESVIELILLGRYFGYFHCLLDRGRIKLSNSIQQIFYKVYFLFPCKRIYDVYIKYLLVYPNKKFLIEGLFAQIGSLRILYRCSWANCTHWFVICQLSILIFKTWIVWICYIMRIDYQKEWVRACFDGAWIQAVSPILRYLYDFVIKSSGIQSYLLFSWTCSDESGKLLLSVS